MASAVVNLRGFVTSLGAGGSLIAAAVCALALFGGLLVFRGAVDDPAEARSGDVTMPGATASADASSRAEPASTPDRARPAATERRARPPRTPAERRVRRPSPAAPVGEAPATGGGPTTTSGEGAGGGSDAPVTGAGDAPAGTVKRTVQQVRETAASVVEAAPEPVQPVVDEVADTVEQIGGTVDETLAPVTGPLPR